MGGRGVARGSRRGRGLASRVIRVAASPYQAFLGVTTPRDEGSNGWSVLAPGSKFPSAFPPPARSWLTRGSLPGHSGGTASDSHRLPPPPSI
jgi:hypothetical protein